MELPEHIYVRMLNSGKHFSCVRPESKQRDEFKNTRMKYTQYIRADIHDRRVTELLEYNNKLLFELRELKS